jgi:3-phenylpropionate/trans-cinnamate dioxygenase ferredoxin subunit
MDEKGQSQWQKLVWDESRKNEPETIHIAECNGKKICLHKFKGQWYGFAYLCPHSSGILAEGEVDPKGNVICPVHGYRYNIRTGNNSTGEGFYLPHWPIQEKADGLYVLMPEKTIL